MVTYGSLWFGMVYYVDINLWLPMVWYGSLWLPMVVYGSVCV